MFQTLEHWDRELLIFLNQLGSERFDDFWIFVTQIESWIPFIALLIFLVLYFFKVKRGLLVILLTLICFGITFLCTDLVKHGIERLRPNNVESLKEFIRILQRPSSPSFFSGHASSSFAISTFVVLAMRKYNKWIYLAFLWPLVFSYSRIYVGVHYPFDIIIGALVGVVIAILCFTLSRKLFRIE